MSTALAGKLNDKDGVLRRETDQHDDPDLHVDIVIEAPQQGGKECAEDAGEAASSTDHGMIQLSYCAASERKTSNTEKTKMMVCVFPTATS